MCTRRTFLALLLILGLVLPVQAAYSGNEVTRWEKKGNYLEIDYRDQTGNTIELNPILMETSDGDNRFIVTGLPGNTQFSLCEGWMMDIGPKNSVTLTKEGGKIEDNDSWFRVHGPNTICLNHDGLSFTVRYSGVLVNRPEHPVVAAHYQAWYRTTDISGSYQYNWSLQQTDYPEKRYFHVDETEQGQAKIAGFQYPLTGPYDSSDPETQRYHAALMKIAGIDAVIFDFYGTTEVADYKNPLKNTNEFIKVLKNAGIKFLICYEEFSALRRDYDGAEVSPTEAKNRIIQTFRDMKKDGAYGWFDDDAYLKYKGRPVVLCFVTKDVLKTRADWEALAAEAGVNPLPFFVDKSAEASGFSDSQGGFNWMPVDTPVVSTPSGRTVWSESKRAQHIQEEFEKFIRTQGDKEYFAVTAYPGFDDRIFDEINRAGENNLHNVISFDTGETFRQTFNLAVSVSPDLIQLGTWNDFNENTVVEPTIDRRYNSHDHVDRGYSSLECVQKWRKSWDTSFPAWKLEELRAPIELYKLAKQPNVTNAQKEIVESVYSAIFKGNVSNFRKLAKTLIDYDLSLKPLLRVEIKTEGLATGKIEEVYGPINLSTTGTAPVVWSANGLPDGLSLTDAGVISGTPKAAGKFTVTVTATNSAGSISKQLTLTIEAAGTTPSTDPTPDNPTPVTPDEEADNINTGPQEKMLKQLEPSSAAKDAVKNRGLGTPNTLQKSNSNVGAERNTSSLRDEEKKAVSDDNATVVAVLPEISVNVSGTYLLGVNIDANIDANIPTGTRLALYLFPRTSGSGGVALSDAENAGTFYDDAGAETTIVPENHHVNVVVELTAGVTYAPVIAAVIGSSTPDNEDGNNNTPDSGNGEKDGSTSGSGGGGGCGAGLGLAGTLALVAVAPMLIGKKFTAKK